MGTNQFYAQKEGSKPAMNSGHHESSASTQQLPRLCQMSIKVDTSRLSQVSRNEEKLRIMPQVSQNSLPNIPICIRIHVNQKRRVQESGLTDLENQMEQAEFASCHLINIEIAINSFLLKRKQQDEGVKNANELKVQNVLYH